MLIHTYNGNLVKEGNCTKFTKLRSLNIKNAVKIDTVDPWMLQMMIGMLHGLPAVGDGVVVVRGRVVFALP